MARNRVLTIFVAIGASACGGEPENAVSVARDSAGVRIVESRAERWAEGEVWRISDSPVLEIKSEELHRISRPLRLGDGRIVFANAGIEVRYYDSTGTLIDTSGRQGRGPGEFTDLRLLFRLPGDSLLGWDTDGSLAGTVLDPAGASVRTITLPPEVEGQRTTLVQHVLGDGTLIGDVRPMDNPWPERTVNGRDLAIQSFARFDATGGTPVHFGSFPNGVCVRRHDLPWCYQDQFGAFGAFAAGDTNFYTAFPERYEIQVRDGDGQLTAVFRREHQAVEVSPEQIAAYERDRLQSAEPEWRESVEEELRGNTYPSELPAFVSMLEDAEGNLWVRDAVDLRMLRGSSIYPPPELDVPASWSVFGPNGEFFGKVVLPEHLDVTDVGDQYLLGVSTDPMGVQSVRMYELIKPF